MELLNQKEAAVLAQVKLPTVRRLIQSGSILLGGELSRRKKYTFKNVLEIYIAGLMLEQGKSFEWVGALFREGRANIETHLFKFIPSEEYVILCIFNYATKSPEVEVVRKYNSPFGDVKYWKNGAFILDITKIAFRIWNDFYEVKKTIATDNNYI